MFFFLTFMFILVSVAMILIILVQRSQGGGLAGAFGGAGGSGTDTVFGGRIGDALTWATVIGFVLYLLIAVLLNRVEINASATTGTPAATIQPDETGGESTGDPTLPADPGTIPGADLPPSPPAIPPGTPGTGGGGSDTPVGGDQ